MRMVSYSRCELLWPHICCDSASSESWRVCGKERIQHFTSGGFQKCPFQQAPSWDSGADHTLRHGSGWLLGKWDVPWSWTIATIVCRVCDKKWLQKHDPWQILFDVLQILNPFLLGNSATLHFQPLADGYTCPSFSQQNKGSDVQPPGVTLKSLQTCFSPSFLRLVYLDGHESGDLESLLLKTAELQSTC